MPYWIFKLAQQELYPDIPGERYIYDNTHSISLQAGDIFLYLDKRKGYAFSATGVIRKIASRNPTSRDAERTSKIHTVFTAHLDDVMWFRKPLSITTTTKTGKSNRAKLGILDINRLGWSRSMPRISEQMYQAIMDLADAEKLIPTLTLGKNHYSIPDEWSKVKVRKSLASFKKAVIERHKNTCVICGTRFTEVVDVAHLCPYAIDKYNRANPANGVCLCTFCHRVLDRRLVAIKPDGELLIAESINDPIALEHLTRVSAKQRKEWLDGVGAEFLQLTVKWFEENLPT